MTMRATTLTALLLFADVLLVAPTARATDPCICPYGYWAWNLPDPAVDVPLDVQIHLWSEQGVEVDGLVRHEGDARIPVEFSVEQVSGGEHTTRHEIVTPAAPLDPQTTYELISPQRSDLAFTTGAAVAVPVTGEPVWGEGGMGGSLCNDWVGAGFRGRLTDGSFHDEMIRIDIESGEGRRTAWAPACPWGQCRADADLLIGRQTDYDEWPDAEVCLGNDPLAREGEEGTVTFTLVSLSGVEGPPSEPFPFSYRAHSLVEASGCGRTLGSPGPHLAEGCGEDEAPTATPLNGTLWLVLLGIFGLRRRR